MYRVTIFGYINRYILQIYFVLTGPYTHFERGELKLVFVKSIKIAYNFTQQLFPAEELNFLLHLNMSLCTFHKS